jgi:hypothetical protein
MNFLIDPNSLLMEIKETMILDCSDIVSVVEEFANELFLSPVLGVYRPNNHVPLFTSHEPLFTHKDAFEFFPEISSHYIASNRKKGAFQQGQVGTPIGWREAVENKINVYNVLGNLVLKATDRRDNFSFNPGPNVYTRQFVYDLTKYFIYKAVPWGETDQVVLDTSLYTIEDMDIEATFENILSRLQATNYFKTVKAFVEKDPFLIYHINTIGSNILVESGCDFRHFKCNQVLWDKEHATDKHGDLFETFKSPEKPFGKIKFEELGGLFKNINYVSGLSISSLTDFYQLMSELEQNTKFPSILQNNILKKAISEVIEKYLQESDSSSKSPRKFISKLIEHKNVRHNSFDFNQTSGVYFL